MTVLPEKNLDHMCTVRISSDELIQTFSPQYLSNTRSTRTAVHGGGQAGGTAWQANRAKVEAMHETRCACGGNYAMRCLARHPISIPRGARAAAAVPTTGGCVPETAGRPSAPLFAAQHMKAQRPVVLRGYCKDWRATQHWHDPEYLRQVAGDDRLLSVERSEDGYFSYASGHGRTTLPLGIVISL